MLDRAVWHPVISAHTFPMESEMLEIPIFGNVQEFVQRLTRREPIVRDELVESGASEQPRAATVRSMPRHFISTIGMTPKRVSSCGGEWTRARPPRASAFRPPSCARHHC
jgi:hypothetical protein